MAFAAKQNPVSSTANYVWKMPPEQMTKMITNNFVLDMACFFRNFILLVLGKLHFTNNKILRAIVRVGFVNEAASLDGPTK